MFKFIAMSSEVKKIIHKSHRVNQVRNQVWMARLNTYVPYRMNIQD